MIFYNSLLKKKDRFKPLKNDMIKMYVCGPTVYGPSHLGHAVTYIRFDFIRRFLEFLGYKVKFVMNITDIHDDILKKSRELKISPQKLADKYTEEFYKDLENLKIKKAFKYPRVSNHLKEIINLIKILIQKGYAYETSDGVYFDISKFKNYGKLSGIKIEQEISGTRVKTDKYEKEEVSDFALWKKENDEWLFNSPWGQGRPGWHIECSAMSIKYLGIPFDIHGGALDLIFPHHENEIAQSEAAYGKKFVNFFLNSGLLYVNGQKMSKSLGNYIELRKFIQGKRELSQISSSDTNQHESLQAIARQKYPARFLRFFVFIHHYRSPIDFNEKNLQNAWETFFNLNEKIAKLKKVTTKQKDLQNLLKILEDDFNSPKFFAELYKLIENNKISLQDLKKLDKFLVFLLPWRKLTLNEKKLIYQREKLRKEKKFTLADKIRNELEKKFIYLQDLKNKTLIINLD